MNKNILQRTHHRKRAAETVELAILLPILFLFLFGIVEFGRILSVMNMLSIAAREGARIASLPDSTNARIIDVVTNELANEGLAYESISFSPLDVSSATKGDPITVTVSIKYKDVTWIPGFFNSLDSIELQKSVVMRKQGV